MITEKILQEYAQKVLSSILAEREYGPLLERLQSEEKKLLTVSRDRFSMEYLPAKLAVACLLWETQCRENGLEGNEKMLFQFVMQLFKSPKMVSMASSFSDYLYASDSEQGHSPMPALVVRLFERLGLQGLLRGKKQGPALSAPFKILVETLEGFRSSLENDFLEFVFTHTKPGK